MPVPQPVPYQYPLPQPVPYKYPVPCPEPVCPPRCCDPGDDVAFGYFASDTAGGVIASGMVPLNFSGEQNEGMSLTGLNNTRVRVDEDGIYRVVYSVSAALPATGTLELLLNDTAVEGSAIPLIAGTNINEIFLELEEDDTVSLSVSSAVTLVAGKNASLLLQRIADL